MKFILGTLLFLVLNFAVLYFVGPYLPRPDNDKELVTCAYLDTNSDVLEVRECDTDRLLDVIEPNENN